MFWITCLRGTVIEYASVENKNTKLLKVLVESQHTVLDENNY